MLSGKSSLFTRDFTLVLIGQIISLFGNSILRFALPLYLLQESGSAALFGLVSAVAFLPMVILSLLGGALADRISKRSIMVVLDFATGGLVLIFSLLLNLAPLIPLMLLTLLTLYGIQGAYQPAVQASIPALLPPDQVLSGNALINQISALSGLAGPVLGGFLMSRFGLSPILTLSIACFFASALMELFIHIPQLLRQNSGNPIVLLREDLKESMGFIRHTKPLLLRLMLLCALVNFVLSALIIVGLPVIITEQLALDEQWMGYCQGAMAMGALLGGAYVGIRAGRSGIESLPTIFILAGFSLLPISLSLLLQLPAKVTYLILLLFSSIIMAIATVASIQLLAYVQKETPVALVGKVIATMMAIALSAQPMGQAIYGLAFQFFPAGVVVLVAGLASISVSIYAFRALRKHLFKGHEHLQ